MANKKFLNPINLVNLSSDPGTANEGDIYYNTTDDAVKVYANGAWIAIGAGGGSETSVSTTAPLNPITGDAWYKNDTGEFYIYDGSFWVEVNGVVQSYSFASIDVSGQDSVIAESGGDTLTLIAGTNIDIITDAANDSITINSVGSYSEVDSITYPDYITFDTTPETVPIAQGSIYWDSGDAGLRVLSNTTSVLLGQEQYALVKNASGSPIAKGKVVYINGAQGQRPTIVLSDADTEATSSKTFGIAAETIADGAEGVITTEGILRGINTDGLTEGGAIWLSSTAGNFTQTMPTQPVHGVFLGYVVKAHASSGEIYVKIQNGYELNELHNVLLETNGNITDNEILAWDSTSGLWKNQTANEAELVTQTEILDYLTIANAEAEYQALDGDLTAIAGLIGTSGLLKKTAVSTWELDTTAYATYGDITNAVEDYVPLSQKGDAQGVAELDIDGFVPVTQLPDLSGTYSVTSHNHTLDSLSNVVITGTPTDGQAIVWDTTTSKWINETVSGGASYPTQTGNDGKFLQTDGTNVSWADVNLTGYVTLTGIETLSNKTISGPLEFEGNLDNIDYGASLSYNQTNGGGPTVLQSTLSLNSFGEKGDVGLSATRNINLSTSTGGVNIYSTTDIILSSSTGGEYLGDPWSPDNQIATIGNLAFNKTFLGMGEYLVDTSYPVSLTNTTQSTTPTSGALIVSGGVGIAKDLWIDGDLHVNGTTSTLHTATVSTHDNLIYLNTAQDATITNAVGDGTYVTYTADNTFAPGMDIRITGMNPSGYNISSADGLTVFSATATQFVIAKTTTGSFVSGGTAHAKTEANADLGFAGGYYDGGYAHAGLFRDSSDGVFKFFQGYTPEPDEAVNIDTTHASFALANISANDLSINGFSSLNSTLNNINSGISQLFSNLSSYALIDGQTFTGTITIPTLHLTNALSYTYGGTGLTTLGTAGQVLKVNSTEDALEWGTVSGGGSGNSALTISSTPPSSPSANDMWQDLDTGRTYVYDGTYWVEIQSNGSLGMLRYLGASSTAPIASIDGSALTVGEVYFDTTFNGMKVWDGDSWNDAFSAASLSVNRWKKTVAGGETSLSGNDDSSITLSYVAGIESVFLNGVKLIRGSDYTATDGSTITGLTALTAGSVVEVISYTGFTVANTYTIAQVDALLSNVASFNSTIAVSGNVNPSSNNAYDLGTGALRWRNVYTQDLHLSNGIGDYTVIEGEEDLFLVNNKSGKSFKFALIEVDPSVVPPKSESN